MRASALVALLGFLCLVSVCTAGVPVPPRYGGYSLGNSDAPVLIEMWGDFQCMDCRETWPVVRKVMSYFGPSKVRVILHVFPLTMHRQAWDAAQTAAIVSQSSIPPTHLFNFFDFMWTNQPAFSQAAFYGKTQADLYSLFSGYATQFGVSNTTYYSKMGSDPIFNLAYNGVEMGADRHIYSTPTFYINGIRSTFDETTPYATWVTFINSLLSQQ